MSRTRIITALALLALVFAGGALFVYRNLPTLPAATPLAQGVYIWQYNWTPEVADAVALHASAFDGLFPFVAELDVKASAYTVQSGRVDWASLAATRKPVWPVVRGRTSLLHEPPDAVAEKLVALAQSAVDAARSAGCATAGIQFDLDAPTDRLDIYAEILTRLRKRLAPTPLAITTLPDWLRSPGFAHLVQGLDHFVLQVHGFRRDAAGNSVLFEPQRVPGWIDAAAKTGAPFYVALPTYGYAVDAPGGNERQTTFADADAVARIVATLRGTRPSNCRGILWFRLPVTTDHLNWPWDTLAAVMTGHAPPLAFHAEVTAPKPGLFEVRVYNDSTRPAGGHVRVVLHWPGEVLRAHDLLGAAHEGSNSPKDGMIVLAPTPAPGEPRLIAWFVLEGADNLPPHPPTVDPVEWTP